MDDMIIFSACTEPKELTCGCKKTCADLADDDYKCTKDNCVEDCYCREGYVLDKKGEYIKEEECACYYQGKVLKVC